VQHIAEWDRPRVFVSFAGSDRVMADRLRQDLEGYGIGTFVDVLDMAPAANIVRVISDALTQSDYCVLLWSQSCVDRPWVEAEWSAAFALEIKQRRVFLFTVRLDATPVPSLLAPRRHLDAFDDNWAGAVDELVCFWERDWAMRTGGAQVLPAPCSAFDDAAVRPPTILLYVRNRDLSVAHVLTVSEKSNGAELDSRVRTALALPESVTEFQGQVGLRFSYQLHYSGEPIVPTTTLAGLGVTDHTTIELQVHMQQFGPTGSSSSVSYRFNGLRDEPWSVSRLRTLAPPITRSLLTKAFGHLAP